MIFKVIIFLASLFLSFGILFNLVAIIKQENYQIFSKLVNWFSLSGLICLILIANLIIFLAIL